MSNKIPKATHSGSLKIGNINIPCAVLEDGTRILTEHGLTTAMKSRSGASKRHKRKAQEEGRAPLPVFMASDNLKPFISNELYDGLTEPVKYHLGKKMAYGFKAELLPQICDVWLQARDAEVLNKQQINKVNQADILMRGLAQIGIIALVDEATGYQYERDRNELNKILEAYIAKELLPWAKRFPDEFYKQLYRLKKWPYPTGGRRTPLVGKLTNQLIYEKLPDGVLHELKQKNPVTAKGYRKHKHHQFLTEDIGNPHLERHIASVTTLMRASSNWRIFKSLFERAFGQEQLEMPFMEDSE